MAKPYRDESRTYGRGERPRDIEVKASQYGQQGRGKALNDENPREAAGNVLHMFGVPILPPTLKKPPQLLLAVKLLRRRKPPLP